MELVLRNKFEAQQDDDTSIKSKLVNTKRMIIEIIRFQRGPHLNHILRTQATNEQELAHNAYQQDLESEESSRQRRMSLASPGQAAAGMRRHRSMLGTSLEQLKTQVIDNLKELVSHGLISSRKNFQDMLNLIAYDIRDQNTHRKGRKKELHKLEGTLESLNSKSKYFEEQMDSFNLYIQSCMNQHGGKAKKGKKSGFKLFKAKKSSSEYRFGSFTYTGAKLKEKGVLVDVDGIKGNQLNTLKITISCKEVGVFEVKITYMGIVANQIELVFQDLLQMQYEGVSVAKMFDTCKINVNLLIFLLNKKFM